MVIKKSSLPAAQSALRELAPKVPDAVSDLAAIKNLRRQIERALRIGYSYDEISQTLAKYDIELSGSQLESGLAQLKKTGKKRSAPKQVKSSELPFPETDLPPAPDKKSVAPQPQKSTARTTKRAY